MLIAVEGPDGAGKSTFVELLRKLMIEDGRSPEVRHSGPPELWPVSEYELGTQDYRPGRGQDIIYDRLHVGEQVYGPIYRGKGMSPGEYEHVTAWLNRLGLVTIFVFPPIDDVRMNLIDRGDAMVKAEDLRAIFNGYTQQLFRYKLPHQTVARYPTKSDGLMALRLGARIEQMNADTAKLNSFIGWRYPEVLLVGDTKSSMAGEHVQAFVPWSGYSGAYLMDAVLQRYVTWAAVNAHDDNVSEAYSLIKPQTVVTLGAVADAECAHYAIPVTKHAWHPSYALRRRGMPVADYARTI